MEKLHAASVSANGDAVTCPWWNIKQAAEYLGVSIAFVRKAVRLGTIPYARAGSKVLRFRRTELDDWLTSNCCGGELPYKDKRR